MSPSLAKIESPYWRARLEHLMSARPQELKALFEAGMLRQAVNDNVETAKRVDYELTQKGLERDEVAEIVSSMVIGPPGEIAGEEVEPLSEEYREKVEAWHESLVPSEDD